MRVGEIGAGGGYITNLLARMVGGDGVVFAVNPPSLLTNRAARAWNARLVRMSPARVVPSDRSVEAPFVEHARDLDVVYLGIFYGDLPRIGVDRKTLVANVFAALRPGGRFVVIDRRPPITDPRSPLTGRQLHIEESRNARREIERGGFAFANEGILPPRLHRAGRLVRDERDAPDAARDAGSVLPRRSRSRERRAPWRAKKSETLPLAGRDRMGDRDSLRTDGDRARRRRRHRRTRRHRHRTRRPRRRTHRRRRRRPDAGDPRRRARGARDRRSSRRPSPRRPPTRVAAWPS